MRATAFTLFFFSIILAFGLSAFGQQQSPTIEAKSSGECRPNILSNQGKVQFTCSVAMDAATPKKIVSLLNQILQRESGTTSPTEDTNRKLDEILDFVRTQAEQSRGLTETVAPRFIWYSARGSKSNIDVLKTFSGWSVRIESIRDVEAEKAARNLGGLLSQAGWNLENNAVLVREESMPDGVTVDQYQAPEMEENPTGVSLEMHSAAVVDEIVAFLLANNWDAHCDANRARVVAEHRQ